MRYLVFAAALQPIFSFIVAPSVQAAIIVTGNVTSTYNGTTSTYDGVDDPWWTFSLSVGQFRSGSLTINDSSIVSNSGDAVVGNLAAGAVTVTGAGSRFATSERLQVGWSGSGTVDITDGGTVHADTVYIGFISESGLVNVGGGAGTSTLGSYGSPLYVGYSDDGTLNITGGGYVTNAGAYLGYFSGNHGTVTVGGGSGGSTWNNNGGPLYVGYSGGGTLNITGGGTVSNSDGYIGRGSGYNGVVTVGGSGTSTWTNSGALHLGGEGNGTLNINTGGLVSAAAWVSGGNGASSLNFNGGTLRITAAASTSNAVSLLSGGGIIDVPSPLTTFTVSGNVSGTGGLTKTGAGSLRLSGSNTYTGTTTISAGALNISDGNDLPANSFLSLDGGVLASRGTFTRSIAAGGAGKLQWTANGGGFASFGGSLTINLGGASAEQIWGDSLGSTMQGPLKFGVNSGGFDLLFQNPVDLNSSATTVDRTVIVTASAEMSGALRNSGSNASLTKSGAGTLTLSGANTYAGATTVAAGTLSVSNIGTAGNSSNLGTNSTINLGATTTTGTFKYTGAGETSDKVINLAGDTGGATIDQSGTGLLKFTSNFSASGNGAKTLTLQGSTAGTGEIDGVIVDSGEGATAVRKTGSGTWTLAATNTYSGTTTVSAGTLRVSDNRNLGAVPASFTTGNIVLDGGTLQFGADFDISNNRGITLGAAGGTIDTQGFTNPSGYDAPAGGFTGTGDLTKTGSGVFFAAAATDDANTTWKKRLIIKQGTWKIVATDGLPYSPPTSDGLQADQLTLDGGTWQIAADITSNNPRRGITVAAGGGTIDIGANSLDWAGPLAGSATSATLTKIGSGALTFNSNYASTYAGNFSINVGTVVLSGGTAMGDKAVVNLANTAGVTLTITDTETIGSLSGGGASGGNVYIPSGLVTGGNNKTTSFDGVISGTGGLTKTGTGTMTLTGANSYNGATSVAAGTLSVSSIGTPGITSNLGTNGTINLGATTVAGTLKYTGTGETSDKVINLAGTTGGGIIDQSGTGLLKFSSSLTASGVGSKTLTLQGSGIGEFDGAIVDSGGVNTTAVTKTGTGTWTLTAAGAYSGTTTISNGTLLLGNDAALGTGQLTLGAGTIAASGGARSIANSTVLTGTSVTIGGSDSFTISGTFTNSGGNRTLTVHNTAITTLSGTVSLSNSGTSRTLTIAGTGNTYITGDISNGSTSTASGLTKTGAGTLAVSGVNTYAGKTSIQNGTLSAASLNKVIGGSASSNLGAPITVANGTIPLGFTTSTGTLAYSGIGETTDRVIDLAGTTGGGTIDSSGTGALSFSSTFTATGPGSKTLTLQGSNTDDNSISGAIVDNSATNKTSLTKSGGGNWILAGANTYSGPTTVSAGALVVAGAVAKLGIGNVTVQGMATGTTLVVKSDVTNAIDDTATLNLLGGGTPLLADQGYLDLGAGLNDRVGSLLLNGVPQAHGITFGSTTSGAIFQSDEYFAGTGLISVGILGDFSGNNSVDASDFVALRKNPSAFGGDSGYNLWRINFGGMAGASSGASMNAAVPEPSAPTLLILAAAGCYLRRRQVV
jgi:autotransporter-associated beta strand protein/T5SS/PEP-CTERM-associated repeat protein